MSKYEYDQAHINNPVQSSKTCLLVFEARHRSDACIIYLYQCYQVSAKHITSIITSNHKGHLRDLVGSLLDHRSLPPEFESQRGHILKAFYL